MQDTIDQPTSGAPAHPKPSRRDVQRTALRDLVTLATECAAKEAEIESRYQKALEDAAKEHKFALFDAQDRLKGARETIEKKQADRGATVSQQFKQERMQLEQADRAARARIDQDFKSVERDIKQKFEQAKWLAESLFDGVQAQANEDFKKAREEHEQDLNYVAEKQQQTLVLMNRYSCAVPEAPAEEAAPELPEEAEPAELFKQQKEVVDRELDVMRSLTIPRLLVGIWYPMLAILILALGAGGAYMATRKGTILWDPSTQTKPVLIAVGAAGFLCVVLWGFLRWLGVKHTRAAYERTRRAVDATRLAAEKKLEWAKKKQQKTIEEAAARRDAEIQASKDQLTPFVEQARQRRESALSAQQAEVARQLPLIEAKRDKHRGEIDAYHAARMTETDQRHQQEVAAIEARRVKRLADGKKAYDDATEALKQRLADGLAKTQAPMGDAASSPQLATWDDPAWKSWKPSRIFPPGVRFGQLHVNLKQIAESVPRPTPLKLTLPEAFDMPLTLAFPRQASLLIQTDRAGRLEGISALQMLMTRILTSLPAGRARFTIFDPVGLGQNFAGFMHLADHDEALVGGRIWTEREQIEQRLADLTEHMETVIQKYLRNEFETIDEYNAQAGELAEPYRFLVIADFPAGFEGESFNRLASIVNSGPRCGIYTFILRDIRQGLPAGTLLDELEAHSVNLVREGDAFVWKDEVFSQFPLALDKPPSDEFLTGMLDVVGHAAKEASRVEVSFDTIAPQLPQFWTLSTSDDLRVPIGRMGATRLQYMKLGKGVAQHVLIAGKTGSGKSTLLNVLITNLSMWYAPDEVEFYLIDFKKGVEFKTYATHQLPHARAIAVESDREFGLSVLQRLDAELTRRGNFFRKLGVQDLPSYRDVTQQGSGPASLNPEPRTLNPEYPKLPRTLLIIDEFQEFFSEDDKLAQDAALLLDRLVRQGRAFGIHVILGSQTIGGSSGLPRSTIGQMAVRVALQTSEADSQLILGDGNSAARLLTRPGEAIYNDAGGLVEGNSPFQVSWLPDEQRDTYLERVTTTYQGRLSNAAIKPYELPIVFEGNAAADIAKNRALEDLIGAPGYPPAPVAVPAFIGDPVAIKDPTAVTFRRQAGANVLLVGQQDESAMGILVSTILSLALQHAPGAIDFRILDGTPADSPLASVLPNLAAALPHQLKLIEYRTAGDAINELAEEMGRRQADPDHPHPPIFLVINGLQRYRILRKSEESFSLSMSDEEKKPQADKQFMDLVREGPSLGIHSIAWCDTPASMERVIDRNVMREFDHRILFQMSSADSSNLIDSPLANKLGFHRALAYSEEQGVIEKFRPYALPPKEWMERVKEALSKR